MRPANIVEKTVLHSPLGRILEVQQQIIDRRSSPQERAAGQLTKIERELQQLLQAVVNLSNFREKQGNDATAAQKIAIGNLQDLAKSFLSQLGPESISSSPPLDIDPIALVTQLCTPYSDIRERIAVIEKALSQFVEPELSLSEEKVPNKKKTVQDWIVGLRSRRLGQNLAALPDTARAQKLHTLVKEMQETLANGDRPLTRPQLIRYALALVLLGSGAGIAVGAKASELRPNTITIPFSNLGGNYNGTMRNGLYIDPTEVPQGQISTPETTPPPTSTDSPSPTTEFGLAELPLQTPTPITPTAAVDVPGLGLGIDQGDRSTPGADISYADYLNQQATLQAMRGSTSKP